MAVAPMSSAVTTYPLSSSGTPPTPSMLGSQDFQLQSEMKATIENEITGATYYVDLTAENSILSAEPRIVQAVNRDLKTTFKYLTYEGESSPAHPRLPKHGFSHEPPSYEPFVQLLNKITDTARKHIPPSPLAPLRQLRFHRFGREVKETYGSKNLKPDGVGILGPPPTYMKELSWEHIEVAIESKGRIREMVRQSGTYARCCLIGNQRRFFSLVIGFNFSTLEAYVFLFHRSGLSSSRPLNVTTQEGFEGLVNHIVGILSIKDEAAYGLDPTRFQNMFCINDRLYELVRHLYVRESLRGRATIVYRLQGTSARPPPGRELKSRTLTLSDGIGHMPDKFTYKQAYQIKGQSQEGPLLSQFTGQFGIADVIGYHNCGTEDPHGSMEPLFTNAEFWNLFKDQDLPEDRKPEKRGLQCIALAGEGKALVDLDNVDEDRPSPGEVLESILHAIIGHYNLFDKGVLHRDISLGNVLCYSEPVERPALDEFECTRNVKYCRGFVIDGDQAIKWREVTGSQEISGTMHFISTRILGIWLDHGSIFHTALDDLESFLWLLIWCIVHLSKDIEGARANNPGINRMLRSWSGDMMGRLAVVMNSWDDAVFGDLIKEWLDTFIRAFNETKNFTKYLSTHEVNNERESRWARTCDRLESFCKKTYEEILRSGFKHLEGVQSYSDWEAVVAANVPMDLDSDS